MYLTFDILLYMKLCKIIAIILWRRSARLIIGMIVSSWVISTIISIPPLFGLQDPADDPIDWLPATNGSVDNRRSTPAHELAADNLTPFEEYEFDLSLDYEGFGYYEPPDVMHGSAETRQKYANETISTVKSLFPFSNTEGYEKSMSSLVVDANNNNRLSRNASKVRQPSS